MTTVLDILLWLGAATWIVFFVQAILNRLLVPDLARTQPTVDGDWPTASIVVPARNEERRIREAVTSLCEQDYPSLEIIVVDDRSTDATPGILAELERKFSNLKVIRGQDPPPDWLGKPNALETGRKQATGDWILFVDADVIYAWDALRRAIAYATRKDVGLLCLWPRLLTGGVVEAALMSSLPLVGFGVAPVYWIDRSRRIRFASGGGAGNLVRRDALEACGAFQTLHDTIVDDVGLACKVKAAGFRCRSILAQSHVRVRMYDGAGATVAGFTKHIYPGLIKKLWMLPLPIVVGIIVSILPYCGFIRAAWLGSVSAPAVIALMFMHATLALVAVIFRQPWYVIFLNPLREVGWWWIAIRSFAAFRRNGLVWRGRVYASS